MKIFSGNRIKILDAYTIEHEPISSIDLMERAAHALTSAMLPDGPPKLRSLFSPDRAITGATPWQWRVCLPRKVIR